MPRRTALTAGALTDVRISRSGQAGASKMRLGAVHRQRGRYSTHVAIDDREWHRIDEPIQANNR